MPSLNYTSNEAEQIISGRQISTIRKSTNVKAEDVLHMFSGACRSGMPRRRLTPIGGVQCSGVHDIEIRRVLVSSGGLRAGGIITLDGHRCFANVPVLIADAGFFSVEAFFDYFTPELMDVFNGQLIRWRYWGLHTNY